MLLTNAADCRPGLRLHDVPRPLAPERESRGRAKRLLPLFFQGHVAYQVLETSTVLRAQEGRKHRFFRRIRRRCLKLGESSSAKAAPIGRQPQQTKEFPHPTRRPWMWTAAVWATE